MPKMVTVKGWIAYPPKSRRACAVGLRRVEVIRSAVGHYADALKRLRLDTTWKDAVLAGYRVVASAITYETDSA